MMKRLLMVTLLIALASNLCMAQQPAYEFPLSGSQLYRLRWGLQEGSADLVPFPPVLGQPVCAQKGSTLQLGIRWNSQHGRLLGWMPLQVVLSRAGTGEVIWQHPYSGSNWLAPDAVYPLRALPDHVEYATLWSEGLLLVWTGSWPLPVGVMPYSTVNTPSEVFVVLDAPKAPMSPAWVNVLPAFHGQCNDLADFLVCAVTSVGALPLRSQRTYRLDAAYFQNDADGGGWQLVTGVVDPAGAAPQNFALTVSYHQFAIYEDKVWDASYGFIKTDGSLVHSIGWSRDSYYKPVLVRRFVRWENHAPRQEVRPSDPENPWNPTPDNGFLPVITAEDLPEAN
jgi:hypothetical protein